MVSCGIWTVSPPQSLYMTFELVPQDVALWAKLWFGHDGPWTEVNILLKTPKFCEIRTARHCVFELSLRVCVPSLSWQSSGGW